MVKKSIYEEVDGLDESFTISLNDVDLCLKIREKGYLNIFTPFAELYHYESKTRGMGRGREAEALPAGGRHVPPEVEGGSGCG